MSAPLRPCRGCPFSPNSSAYLHPVRAEEIASVARDGHSDFYLGMIDARHYETVDPEHRLAFDPDEMAEHHARGDRASAS